MPFQYISSPLLTRDKKTRSNYSTAHERERKNGGRQPRQWNGTSNHSSAVCAAAAAFAAATTKHTHEAEREQLLVEVGNGFDHHGREQVLLRGDELRVQRRARTPDQHVLGLGEKKTAKTEKQKKRKI